MKGICRRFVAMWVLASPGRPSTLFCLCEGHSTLGSNITIVG